MNENTIPEGAVTPVAPFCSGYEGRIDFRRLAIREATRPLLQDLQSDDAGAAVLVGNARQRASQVIRAVWQLYARLEMHERAQAQLAHEITATEKFIAEIDLSDPDATQQEGRLRQARLKLMGDARDESLKWLDARSDSEERIGDLLQEHALAMIKLSLVTQHDHAQPTLTSLLSFLDKPRSTEVYVLDATDPALDQVCLQ